MGQGVKKSLSLLDWINQAGNSSLEQVADSCYRFVLFITGTSKSEIMFVSKMLLPVKKERHQASHNFTSTTDSTVYPISVLY
jgi:hypothetical protein